MKTFTSSYFRERAAESQLNAESATLENVRDTCLRSEAAWREMGDQASSREAERERSVAVNGREHHA